MAERKTALITGASSGIGLDLARVFAREGWELVLVARGEAKLREIATQLGVTTTVIAADLSKPDAAQRLHEELRAKSLTIDALVNNAGLGVVGPFAESDLAK